MTVAEQVYELVRALPEDQAAEVLNFAEFVQAKNKGKESFAADTTWHDLLKSLSGTWGDDFPTAEEIRATEGQDVPRESL